MTRIIGIDLGTTNSAIAVADEATAAHAVPITQVVGPGEIAERADPAVVPAAAERARGPARAAPAAVVGAAALRGRHVRARARRRAAPPAGVVGQVVAVQPVDRSHRAGAAVPRRAARARAGDGGRRAGVAGQRERALPRAPARGVGRRPPRRARRRAGGAGHRAGVVRSGRARADRGRRARGRVRQDHAARGAAGRVLRVPRGARRRLAQGARARRRRARVRRRRRHHRLLADRGRATRRARSRSSGSRSAITSCSAATTWISRSPRSWPSSSPTPARRSTRCRQRALVHACRRAKEQLLGDQPPKAVPISILGRGSKLIGGTIKAEVTREQAEADAGRRVLPDRRPPTRARRAAGRPACARWACPTPTIPRSPATSPSSSPGSGGCRPRCCSTAA